MKYYNQVLLLALGFGLLTVLLVEFTDLKVLNALFFVQCVFNIVVIGLLLKDEHLK